jgi:hypothetical protein
MGLHLCRPDKFCEAQIVGELKQFASQYISRDPTLHNALNLIDRQLESLGARTGVINKFIDAAANIPKAITFPEPAAFNVVGIDGKFITNITNPQNIQPSTVTLALAQLRAGFNSYSHGMILHNLQSATDLRFDNNSNLKDYGTSPQLMWTDQDPNVTRFFRLRSSYDGQTWNPWQVFSSALVCGPIGVQSGLLRTAAITPVNGAGTPTTQPLGAVTGVPVNAATINVASFIVQYPAPIGNKTYNSGAITPLNDATLYYVYCLDPTYAGGVQTYLASVNNPDVTGNDAIVFLGSITTPVHGAGGTTGTGGGNGPCFSGNTRILLNGRIAHISDVETGDRVLTMAGWLRVKTRIEHQYAGEMCAMGNDEFVTPGHRFWFGPGGSVEGWIPARNVFPEGPRFTGTVFNLEIEGDGSDETQCYSLANGYIAHNVRK